MKIALFSAQPYERPYFIQANRPRHELVFIPESLSLATVAAAHACQAVCCFVLDELTSGVLRALQREKVELIALRSAGYDHVDLAAAQQLGLTVVNVPNYSPPAVAEFAVGLILALSRRLRATFARTQRNNFSLDNELLGFNLHNKTVGIIGTGRIGMAFARIMRGFGCDLLAYDRYPNDECRALGVKYLALDELLSQADIVSLHCALNAETFHIINARTLASMKKEALLINTGRGALIDTAALLHCLCDGHLAGVGLDVYEREKQLFFIDHGMTPIKDKQFLQLQRLPNVIITPHQAFFTQEAVGNIAHTTLANITAFAQGRIVNQVQ